MNFFKQILTVARFAETETPYLHVETSTRWGYIADSEGRAQRVDSNHRRVIVPTYDWMAQKVDEDEVIGRVAAEAAKVVPLRVTFPVDANFWIKNRRHLKGFAFHPNLAGQFFVPVGVPCFKHESLPVNQLTCFGVGAFTGYYVEHGQYKRGVLFHDKKGLLSLMFP